MKVKELIAHLKVYNPECDVQLSIPQCGNDVNMPIATLNGAFEPWLGYGQVEIIADTRAAKRGSIPK